MLVIIVFVRIIFVTMVVIFVTMVVIFVAMIVIFVTVFACHVWVAVAPLSLPVLRAVGALTFAPVTNLVVLYIWVLGVTEGTIINSTIDKVASAPHALVVAAR